MFTMEILKIYFSQCHFDTSGSIILKYKVQRQKKFLIIPPLRELDFSPLPFALGDGFS